MIFSPLAKQLASYKIIPVIVVESVEDALMIGQQLVDNHLPVAEITFRSAAACAAIKALKTHYPDLCVGAGTVLTAQQTKEAKEAGADFIVSPGFNRHTVRAAKALDLAIIPGVNNPTTIEMALEEGINEVKFFPAEASGGINMVTSLLAPYGELAIMPTGGINPNNVHQYLAIERVIACGLSWMVAPNLIAAKNWTEIGTRIREINQMTR